METPLPSQQPQSTWDGPPTPPQSPSGDAQGGAVLRNNLLAFLVYTVVGFVLAKTMEMGFFILLIHIPHAIILFIVGFGFLLQKKVLLAGQYFAAGCAILAIGLGTCAFSFSFLPF